MNKELIEIIKEIESYENEEVCMIVLSQEQSKALLDYIRNLEKENIRLKDMIITSQDSELIYRLQGEDNE